MSQSDAREIFRKVVLERDFENLPIFLKILLKSLIEINYMFVSLSGAM